MYLVFIFISVTIFDFKVFQENLTEPFFLSIFGIFAFMAGDFNGNSVYLAFRPYIDPVEKKITPQMKLNLKASLVALLILDRFRIRENLQFSGR